MEKTIKTVLNTEQRPTMVASPARDSNMLVLRLKPDIMIKRYGHELSGLLLDLDVTVLTRLIFMDVLGFDQDRLDNEKLISYASQCRTVIDAVANNQCDLAFFLNPTRIDQVQKIAEAGLIMPRKSTYFYPKALTGLVLNTLDPAL